jgi:hypothetical protein
MVEHELECVQLFQSGVLDRCLGCSFSKTVRSAPYVTVGTAAVGPEESPLLAAHHEIFRG